MADYVRIWGCCLSQSQGELLHQGFYAVIVNNLDNTSEVLPHLR